MNEMLPSDGEEGGIGTATIIIGKDAPSIG